MIDGVYTYHADLEGCGVSKFSSQLAAKLGVSFGAVQSVLPPCDYPLWSLKPSEVDWRTVSFSQPYDVFLHDFAHYGVRHARRVFAASHELAERLKDIRPDVIPAWCPSLVSAQPHEPITVFSMGMAHKLRTDLYATLKEKLDATGENYVVYVSAALHEGTNFSSASASFESLRKLFGQRFVFLGTLSDEALVDRLRRSTYVAAFFDHGLRENNTSVMAAIDNGAVVVTNRDKHTPERLCELTIDVRHHELPHAYRRERLRHAYSWDELAGVIRAA